MNSLLPLVVTLIGALVLVGGIFSFFAQRAKIAQFRQTEGTVTELLGSSTGRPSYVVAQTEEGLRLSPKRRSRPQVEFTAENGRTVKIIGRVASRPARYQIGERVSVLYNPADPADAQINSFVELWFVTLMLVGFGLLTLVMGAMGWALSS